MNILVVNAGSSTLKCQFINTATGESLMKSLAERIGDADAVMSLKFIKGDEEIKYNYDVANLPIAECLKLVLEALGEKEGSPISSLDELDAVGNRIVSGGEYFTASALMDAENFERLKPCEQLAPLHNPNADACIEMMAAEFPELPQVCVFDTAFHQTMPPKAYRYPLPKHYYEDLAVRRYGAHGTSHAYAAQTAAELMGKPIEELKLITCHLGSGASISAVDGGKCIDTSMGMTPLEGLMMGTRTGSMDPAIVTYIMEKDGLTPAEMDNLMNKQSGFLGVSGVSADTRYVEQAAAEGNEDAQLAIDMFIYRVVKIIGSYYAALGGLDGVVFTAGIGENSAEFRKMICDSLKHMGLHIDDELNDCRGVDRVISTEDSPVAIVMVAADEEMCIARDTEAIVSAL